MKKLTLKYFAKVQQYIFKARHVYWFFFLFSYFAHELNIFYVLNPITNSIEPY